LLFGLTLAVTKGSFNLIEFNVGVLILLLDVALYMFGHALVKKLYNKDELTPYQFIFVRNLVSGVLLISTYFLLYPLENMGLFLDPVNIFYFILIGVVYGFGMLFWSKTLSYITMGKTIILISFSVFVSAIFASIFLGEIFTIFHLVGTSIVLFSIIIIVREKKD